jgi:RNA polymerase sigma-70 factor (ECF subfamily)
VTDAPAAARSDLELMAAHAEGDAGAFGEVVRRHRDRLWAVALRTLGDREEAADALQDALVSALRASSSRTSSGTAAFRGESAVTTWLHRIVVNACLDRVRRRASRPVVPLPDHDLAARGPDPVATRELAIDLEAALATLPAEQRAAVVLGDMYGWSVQDASEVLECAVGTVKSRCSRGRARLLPLLRPETEGNPGAGARVPPRDEPPAPAETGERTPTPVPAPAATSATPAQRAEGGDPTR